MNVQLLKMRILNFKGIKDLTTDFESNTIIYGANGTGKTTIFDAFLWALFGKDSTDRKDFEVKTLDDNNLAIPKIDHEVSLSLKVDSEVITVRRVLKEKWTKKRGTDTTTFEGNVSEYYWNEVPMNQKDFQAKINSLMDETIFKLVTSPLAFSTGTFGNSKQPMWKNRREVLLEIAGGFTDKDFAKGHPQFEELLSRITQGKTLEDYQLQISASVKKEKENLKFIPTRIDEISRSCPESLNFEEIQAQIYSKSQLISQLDVELADKNKAYDSLLKAKNDLKFKRNDFVYNTETRRTELSRQAKELTQRDTSIIDGLNRQLIEKQQRYNSIKETLQLKKSRVLNLDADISSLEQRRLQKRQEWEIENAKQIDFSGIQTNCPTCQSQLSVEKIESNKEQMIASFNSQKQNNLLLISNSGKSFASQIDTAKDELRRINEQIAQLESETPTLSLEIGKLQNQIEEVHKASNQALETYEEVYSRLVSEDAQLKMFAKEISDLDNQIGEEIKVDNASLLERKKTLMIELDDLKAKLGVKAQIESVKLRIVELENEEKELGKKVLEVEREQFLIEQFIKHKIESLEQSINNHFKFVKFKLFEEQINGGVRETCEAMVNGVPYSDINTASKINAGLDIINTLSKHYNVQAPIFVDNAESVHTLIETNSQLIKLIVDENSKNLTVECNSLTSKN